MLRSPMVLCQYLSRIVSNQGSLLGAYLKAYKIIVLVNVLVG